MIFISYQTFFFQYCVYSYDPFILPTLTWMGRQHKFFVSAQYQCFEIMYIRQQKFRKKFWFINAICELVMVFRKMNSYSLWILTIFFDEEHKNIVIVQNLFSVKTCVEQLTNQVHFWIAIIISEWKFRKTAIVLSCEQY